MVIDNDSGFEQDARNWVPNYHNLGPDLDLNDPRVKAHLFNLLTSTLVGATHNPDEDPKSVVLKGLKTPELFTSLEYNPVLALDVASILMDVGDSLYDRTKFTSIGFYKAVPYAVSRVNRQNLDPEKDLALDATKLDALTWLRNEGVTTEDELNEFRIEFLKKLHNNREAANMRVADGQAFEYVLKLLLEFKLQKENKENKNNFVRMSRTREDKPEKNMDKEKGPRLAHDIVLMLDGFKYRIQAKFKFNKPAEDPSSSYNLELIDYVEEAKEKGKFLDNAIKDLLEAFNGNSPSAERRVLELADRYLSAIAPKTPAIAAKTILKKTVTL